MLLLKGVLTHVMIIELRRMSSKFGREVVSSQPMSGNFVLVKSTGNRGFLVGKNLWFPVSIFPQPPIHGTCGHLGFSGEQPCTPQMERQGRWKRVVHWWEKKYSIIWRIFMDFPTWGSSKLSQVIPIQSSLTGSFDATWSWSSKVQPATAWVQLSNGP